MVFILIVDGSKKSIRIENNTLLDIQVISLCFLFPMYA